MRPNPHDTMDLLERCRRRDENAWRTLYELHGQRTARFVRMFIGPLDDVDDLVQQVFIEVVSSLDKFRNESSFETWLFTITRHVVETHRRARFRNDRKCRAIAEWSEVTELREPDPASSTEWREVGLAVTRVLDEMDESHRYVWIMAEVEKMRCEEIAEALGIPEGTVRSRLHYARKRVLNSLAEKGFDFGQLGVVISLDRKKD